MRALKWLTALVVVGVPVLGVASAASASQGYTIAVQPLSQTAGGSVHVTGSDPLDNCPSSDVQVTLTYFTQALVQKTTTTDLGTADGSGNIQGNVTIPSDAGPTSATAHVATLVAACGDGFTSNVANVTVSGTVVTTTTTTTVLATTTTAVAPATTAAPTTTTAAPATLPRTGAASGPWALLGLVTLGSGAALVLSQRRRSQRTS